jgi:carotenoid cleavage dioxygenase-like enzyme
MVHDFAVTPNYAVFIICPLKVNVVKALLGLGGFNGLFQYDASEDAEVIVVPWSDVEHPIRIPVAPRFIFHFANAHDEDGELTIDFVQYPNADVVTALSGNDEKTGPLRMRLQRMRIDVPRRRVLSDEILWNHTCEFPWVPPQQVGHRYDTLWLVAREKGHGQGIVRLSPDDGTVDHWLPGEGIRSSEPMFVPRPGGSVGQGWLVCLCLDGYAKKSFFAVLDASRPSDGPVAKLWLDQPLHSTYHGIVIEGL